MNLRRYIPKIKIQSMRDIARDMGYDWDKLSLDMKFVETVFQAYIPGYNGEAAKMILGM